MLGPYYINICYFACRYCNMEMVFSYCSNQAINTWFYGIKLALVVIRSSIPWRMVDYVQMKVSVGEKQSQVSWIYLDITYHFQDLLCQFIGLNQSRCRVCSPSCFLSCLAAASSCALCPCPLDVLGCWPWVSLAHLCGAVREENEMSC